MITSTMWRRRSRRSVKLFVRVLGAGVATKAKKISQNVGQSHYLKAQYCLWQFSKSCVAVSHGVSGFRIGWVHRTRRIALDLIERTNAEGYGTSTQSQTVGWVPESQPSLSSSAKQSVSTFFSQRIVLTLSYIFVAVLMHCISSRSDALA